MGCVDGSIIVRGETAPLADEAPRPRVEPRLDLERPGVGKRRRARLFRLTARQLLANPLSLEVQGVDLVSDVVPQTHDLPELSRQVDAVLGVDDLAEIPIEAQGRLETAAPIATPIVETAGVTGDEALVGIASIVVVEVGTEAELDLGPEATPFETTS